VGERPPDGGKRRPVTLLPVNQVGLLRAAGATLALTDEFGSGGLMNISSGIDFIDVPMRQD